MSLLRKRAMIIRVENTPVVVDPPSNGGSGTGLGTNPTILASAGTYPNYSEGSVSRSILETYMGLPATSLGATYETVSFVNNGELRIKFPASDPAPTFGVTYKANPGSVGPEFWCAMDTFVEDIGGQTDEYWLSGKLGLGLFGGSKPGGGNQKDDGGSFRSVWHTDADAPAQVKNGSPPTLGGYFYAFQYIANSYGVTRFGSDSSPVIPNTTLPIGEWYRVAIGAHKGTPGNSNGWAEVWIRKAADSAPVAVFSAPNFAWQASGKAWNWNEFKFEPHHGGNQAVHTPGFDAWRRYKNFQVGTSMSQVIS